MGAKAVTAWDFTCPDGRANQSQSGRMIAIGMSDDSFVTLDPLLVTGIQRHIKPRKNGVAKQAK